SEKYQNPTVFKEILLKMGARDFVPDLMTFVTVDAIWLQMVTALQNITFPCVGSACAHGTAAWHCQFISIWFV
ncbi:MAG: hypothetical protein OXC68_00395, partial [Aestuariivita sp.]|nr:hypothetical protein [Aestuariivita sp.]